MVALFRPRWTRRDALQRATDSLPHEIGHILGFEDQYKTPHNHVTPDQEREHQGELMGKRLANGQREISPREMGEIAKKVGMTCDFDRCCHRQAHPMPDPPKQPDSESKPMKSLYCGLGFRTGEWIGSEPPETEYGLPPEAQTESEE